ncbi:DUF4326 domain-containing protein [Streptomyces monomycini]|uniref:DUF4326 domain-containing protein n=1 Tax=Streptomyces monomycini TaxID=371720 RepID=UPI0009984F16|nr:DUF4326 domain-containing protein [Streptomyces monomycini]
MPARYCGASVRRSPAPGRAVFVGRGLYGNPFRAGDPSPVSGGPMTAQEAVDLYEAIFTGPVGRRYARTFARTLHGRDLVCTCPLGAPCHADFLLQLANPMPARHFFNRGLCSSEGPS